MDQIVRGHWWMVGCTVLYLVWWCIFFAPDASGEKPSPTGPLNATDVVCILGAVICGGLAVQQMAAGMSVLTTAATDGKPAIPGLWIDLGCGALYGLLLWITMRFFDRPVTTELALFCSWTALELNAASCLASDPTVSSAAIALIIALTLATLAACTVCYTLYYRLPYVQSFWDGCIPLTLVGAVSAVIALFL